MTRKFTMNVISKFIEYFIVINVTIIGILITIFTFDIFTDI